MIKLYIVDNKKKLREWRIYSQDHWIHIEHGIYGGQMQLQNEVIRQGKAGRNIEEQIQSRINSRVNKMKDRGYVESIEQATSGRPTNKMGFLKPMLAQPLKNVKRGIDWSTAMIQRKYDGHRCIITRHNGEIIAYSRNGKAITAITHILKDANEFLQLEEGTYFDGELYCHGVPLQTISSWAKRKQDKTENLIYQVYDIISDRPFENRFIDLVRMVNPRSECIKLAPSYYCPDMDKALELTDQFILEGYEGGILRQGSASYEDGKRSKSLVKIKRVMDANYLIIGIEESREGYGILRCITEGGDEFSVTAPGTMDEKYIVAGSPEDYIGRNVRVEFATITLGGVPFHPVATNYV